MKNKTHKRAIKQKDVERINVLHFKHPGDLTEDEKKELEKLENLRAKYGVRSQ